MPFATSSASAADTPSARSTAPRVVLWAALPVLAISGGYWMARTAPPPAPAILTREPPPATPRSSRTGPPPSSTPQLSGQTEPAAAEVACAGSSPGPSWTCVDGSWQANVPQASSGSGSGGGAAAGGCRSGQPGPSFICQGGAWVLSLAPGGGAADGRPSEAGSPAGQQTESLSPATPGTPSSTDALAAPGGGVQQPPAVPLNESAVPDVPLIPPEPEQDSPEPAGVDPSLPGP